MSSALLERTTETATKLQGHAYMLNALARHAQLHDMTDDAVAAEALPIFHDALLAARRMHDDELASAMLREFRSHLVPSALRAWDPWIKVAYPSMSQPPIRWICAPDLS